MKYSVITDEINRTRTELSEFDNGTEVKEYQVMIHLTNSELSFADQLANLHGAYNALVNGELKAACPVFKRYFLSDAANQEKALSECLAGETAGCATSIVEQPLLNRTKIAVWVWFQTGVKARCISDGLFEVPHNNYKHLWDVHITGGNSDIIDSKYQTLSIFNKYIANLTAHGCGLKDNCIRTWLFVNNIDVNYAGMVSGRNEIFAKEELTDETHYIASTGIYGRTADPKHSVVMDAYAVDGLSEGQVQYLYAPTHLNRTHEYGVSFERGTVVRYGDRQHVFISGTASIDNKGRIVWVGNIRNQTLRMWENVEVLLAEAGCTFEDVAKMIVYLRDSSDYGVVSKLFEERFPEMPKVFVQAAVCRPEWLIEIECIAVSDKGSEEYSTF